MVCNYPKKEYTDLMEAVTLTKGAVEKTVDGKKIDANNLVIPDEHIISSKGKTLKGIGMKKQDPKVFISGSVDIYDGSTLVVTIDRLKLSNAIAAIVSASEKDGVKKVYEIDRAMVPVGYTQKEALIAKGDYNDLIFYLG